MYALLMALAITVSQERMVEYCDASGVLDQDMIECVNTQVDPITITETIGDDQ